MRRKNWLLILILLPLASLILIVGGTYLLWGSVIEPKVRAEIIDAVKKSERGDIELERIEIASLLPPRLALEKGSFTSKQLGVRIAWKRIEASVGNLIPSLASLPNGILLTLTAIEPQVEYRAPIQTQTQPAPLANDDQEQESPSVPQIGIQIEVDRGGLRYWSSPEAENPTATVQDLAIKISGATHPEARISFEIEGRAETLEPGFPLTVPFSLKTETLRISPEFLEVSEAQLAVLGIAGSFSGRSDLKTQKHAWKGQIDIADLKSLPTPPQMAMVKSASGPVKLSFEAEKSGTAPPRIELKADVGPVLTSIDASHEDIAAKGDIQAQVQVDAGFNEKLLIRSLKFSSDLTQLSIKKKGLFDKPAGTTLSVKTQIQSEGESLNLSSAELRFHALTAKAQGTLGRAVGQTSNLEIEVLPTPLIGFEKFLLPLKEHPLQGQIAAKAFVGGDLSQPKSLALKLDPLSVSGLTGSFAYVSEDKKKQLSGPFRVDVKGKVTLQDLAPRSADLTGSMDISGMNVMWDELFSKKGNESLTLNFSALMQKDLSMRLSGRLLAPFATSNFNLQIKPTADLKGPLQINGPIVLENLNLTDVTRRVGPLKPFAVQGWVRGKVDLQGQYNPEKAPLANDIRTNADLTFFVEQYQFKSPPAPTGEAKDAIPAPLPPPEPFLPREPIFRNLKLSLKGELKKFLFNDLLIQNIQPQIRIEGGKLTGSTTIGDLFGGKVSLSRMSVPLLTAPDRTQGQLSIQLLNIAKATAWAKPEFKDAVKGLLNLETSYDAPLPGHGEMTKLLKAQGKAEVDQFVLSTLKLDEMINDLVSKIPGQKAKANSKGVSAKLVTDFSLSDATFRFQNLDLLTSDRNQLKANGQAGFDLSLKMKGQLFLAGVSFPPRDLACLGDNQGRVEIPIEYSGSLTSPKYSAAAGIFGKLAEKYAACQLKQVQKDTAKKVESEVKKGLEDLAKKKLKGLFGN